MMSKHKNLLITAAMCLGMSASAAVADNAQISTDLQIVMQRHIERSMIDGAIIHIDDEAGEIFKLFPTKAHALIMKGADFFVLCADLKDEAGRSFEVDYYLVESPRGFKVVRTEVDNREVLKKMVRAGLVSKL
ncbi:MAG: hypothetical protein AAGF53_19235 [Pseudomonadota bacterium]